MNLRHLEFALAAARERSFSRAAERCHVTQPTLSNGIALLEGELGGQIFVRTTRKVDLSAFGQQILPLIEAVVQARTGSNGSPAFTIRPTRSRIACRFWSIRGAFRCPPSYLAEHPGVEAFFKECYLAISSSACATASRYRDPPGAGSNRCRNRSFDVVL